MFEDEKLTNHLLLALMELIWTIVLWVSEGLDDGRRGLVGRTVYRAIDLFDFWYGGHGTAEAFSLIYREYLGFLD